jgi:DNA (cytosine-5)-methyltransferase 1
MIEDKKLYTILDLFAGAGGLSLGAARAGFKVICAVEKDKKAIDTHKSNFPEAKHLELDLSGDVVSEIRKSIGNVNLTGIIGGPPCQGFSVIGQKNTNDIRNDLFISFFQIVKKLAPVFFIAENVPGILNNRFTAIREKAFGYINDYENLPPLIVKASDYGVPTTRTRVFFIGYKKGIINRLNIKDFEDLKEKSEKILVKQALCGLPTNICQIKNGIGIINQDEIDKMSKQFPFFVSRVSGFRPEGIGNAEIVNQYINNGYITGCLYTKHSKEIKKRYGLLDYGEHDRISKSTKLNPDGLCPTLRAGTGPEHGSFQAVRPIHYKYSRVITPREAARLQGFPDWFVFQPTIWHSFRQIGNSVSPIVAEKIFSIIRQKITW